MAEKKVHVTLEQVLRFVFHLSLDKPVDQRMLLPVNL
mgnify:CR=1 FL=1